MNKDTMTLEEYKAKYTPKRPRVKNNKMIEDGICRNQILPFLRFWKNAGKLPKDCWWTKIDNETVGAHKNLAFKNYHLGKVSGLGDYLITWGINHGWIEVKKPGEKQRDSQIKFENDCINRGVPYDVVKNETELESALKKWGILK